MTETNSPTEPEARMEDLMSVTDEDRRGAVDALVNCIDNVLGPILEEVVQQTGWSREEVLNLRLLGEVQSMNSGIGNLIKVWNESVEAQRDLLPRQKKIIDAALREESDEDWKKGKAP